MKKEDCEARALIALAIGVGFGVLIGAALLASFYAMFQSKEWAAWVQALGSIGAIVGAVIISKMAANSASRLENEKEKRERERLEFGYRCVIENLIDELKIHLKREGLDGRSTSIEFWENHSKLRFKSNLSAVINLPLYDLGGKERIDTAFLLKDLAINFDTLMDNIANGRARDEAFSITVNNGFPKLLDMLEILERRYLNTFDQK